MPKLAYDALKAAIAVEMLINDQKGNLKMPLKIFAVIATEDENNEDELEEEENVNEEEAALNSLNTIRIQRGKTPFKKFPGSYQKSNGNGAHNGAGPKTTNREPMI